MIDLLTFLEGNALSVFIREFPSVFGFPTILFLHTLGLAMVAGVSIAIDLWVLRGGARSALPRMLGFTRTMWLGFGINLLSGIALLLAYPAKALVVLNPRLREFGDAEIERTLLHELAHVLAHHRAGRRRIAPHGPEWQRACRDLGMPDEKRCHDLPLPRRTLARPHAYRCPQCAAVIRRTRPLRRRVACFACCRTHSGGRYDERFRLVKIAAE